MGVVVLGEGVVPDRALELEIEGIHCDCTGPNLSRSQYLWMHYLRSMSCIDGHRMESGSVDHWLCVCNNISSRLLAVLSMVGTRTKTTGELVI